MDRDLNFEFYLETAIQNLNPHLPPKKDIPTLTFKNITIFLKHSQTSHTFDKSTKACRFRNLTFRQHAEETTKGKLMLAVSFSYSMGEIT